MFFPLILITIFAFKLVKKRSGEDLLPFLKFSKVNSLKVSSIVLNNFTNDSRVEKQAITLSRAGFDSCFGLWKMGLKSHEVKAGYKIERIKLQTISWRGRLGRLLKFIEYSFRVAWRIKNGVIIHCHDYHPLPAMLWQSYFSDQNLMSFMMHMNLRAKKLDLIKLVSL